MKRTLLLKFTVILIILNGFSCDIFKTRDPQEPSQAKSNFLPPTSPDMVLDNLKNSISEKNSINYIQCLANKPNGSFIFIPPPDVQNKYLSVFSNWDLDYEKSYFENLKSHIQSNAKSDLGLTGNYTLTQTDSVIYNADYVLFVPHDLPSIPQVIKGNLQFSISRDKNNNWAITKWIDNRTSSQFCWSELKAQLSN
jgi:hypothetical protein